MKCSLILLTVALLFASYVSAEGCDDCNVSADNNNKCHQRGAGVHVCVCDREAGYRLVEQGQKCLPPTNPCDDAEDWCRIGDNSKNKCTPGQTGTGDHTCTCEHGESDECARADFNDAEFKWCANPTNLRCEAVRNPCYNGDLGGPCKTKALNARGTKTVDTLNQCLPDTADNTKHQCVCLNEFRVNNDGTSCDTPDVCQEGGNHNCNYDASLETFTTKTDRNKCLKGVIGNTKTGLDEDGNPSRPGYYCQCAASLGWNVSPAPAKSTKVVVGTESRACIAQNWCASDKDPCGTKKNIGNKCTNTDNGFYTCSCNTGERGTDGAGWYARTYVTEGGADYPANEYIGIKFPVQAQPDNAAAFTKAEQILFQGYPECQYVEPVPKCSNSENTACMTDAGNECHKASDGSAVCTCSSPNTKHPSATDKSACIAKQCYVGSTADKACMGDASGMCVEGEGSNYHCTCGSGLAGTHDDVTKQKRCVLEVNLCLVGDPCQTRQNRENSCTFGEGVVTCHCGGRWEKKGDVCVPPGAHCQEEANGNDACSTKGHAMNVCIEGGGDNTFSCECNEPGFSTNGNRNKCFPPSPCQVNDPCRMSEHQGNTCHRRRFNSVSKKNEYGVDMLNSQVMVGDDPFDLVASEEFMCKCAEGWTEWTGGEDEAQACLPPDACHIMSEFDPCQTRSNPMNKCVNRYRRDFKTMDPFAVFETKRHSYTNIESGIPVYLYRPLGNTGQSTYTQQSQKVDVQPATTYTTTRVVAQPTTTTATTTRVTPSSRITSTRQNVYRASTGTLHYDTTWRVGFENSLNVFDDPMAFECQCHGDWVAPIGSMVCMAPDPCAHNPCGDDPDNVCFSPSWFTGKRTYMCFCGAEGSKSAPDNQSCAQCVSPCSVGDPCRTHEGFHGNDPNVCMDTGHKIPTITINDADVRNNVNNALNTDFVLGQPIDVSEIGQAFVAQKDVISLLGTQHDCFGDEIEYGSHRNTEYCSLLFLSEDMGGLFISEDNPGVIALSDSCSEYTCQCGSQFDSAIEPGGSVSACMRCIDPCLSDPCDTRVEGTMSGNRCIWQKGTVTDLNSGGDGHGLRQYTTTHAKFPSLSKNQRLRNYVSFNNNAGGSTCGTYTCVCDPDGWVDGHTTDGGAAMSCERCSDPCVGDPCFAGLDSKNQCNYMYLHEDVTGTVVTLQYTINAGRADFCMGYVCECEYRQGYVAFPANDPEDPNNPNNQTCNRCVNPCESDEDPCNTADTTAHNTCTVNIPRTTNGDAEVTPAVLAAAQAGATRGLLQTTRTTTTRIGADGTTRTSATINLEPVMINARADDQRLPEAQLCGEYFCNCDDTAYTMMTNVQGEHMCMRAHCKTPEELCGANNPCNTDHRSYQNTCEVVTLDTYLYTGDNMMDASAATQNQCRFARKCTCTESEPTDADVEVTQRRGFTVLNHSDDGFGQQCFEFPDPCQYNSCQTTTEHFDDEGNSEFLNKCIIDDVFTGDFHCSCMDPDYSASLDGWDCITTARQPLTPTPRPTRTGGALADIIRDGRD